MRVLPVLHHEEIQTLMEPDAVLVADRREEEKEPDKNESGHSQRLTDADIMMEIREQMKRTREDVEEHWQHTEAATVVFIARSLSPLCGRFEGLDAIIT